MTTWIDGALVGEQRLPQRTGVAPFETIGARSGALPLWDLHWARLGASAARLGLPLPPAAGLRAAAGELLRVDGHADGVLRLLLLPGAARVHTVMTARARSPLTALRLLPTVVAPLPDAPPGDLKAEPRRFYDLVRQQAQDGGADDGLVVAADGSVLEAALGNLWLRRDGAWITPALDGRVLPGIARGLLLAGLRARGVAVVERRCVLDDLHAAEALAHSNAVHGPRPACLAGGRPAVAIVDSELGAVWAAATAG